MIDSLESFLNRIVALLCYFSAVSVPFSACKWAAGDSGDLTFSQSECESLSLNVNLWWEWPESEMNPPPNILVELFSISQYKQWHEIHESKHYPSSCRELLSRIALTGLIGSISPSINTHCSVRIFDFCTISIILILLFQNPIPTLKRRVLADIENDKDQNDTQKLFEVFVSVAKHILVSDRNQITYCISCLMTIIRVRC